MDKRSAVQYGPIEGASDIHPDRLTAAIEAASFLGRYGVIATRAKFSDKRFSAIHATRNEKREPTCALYDEASQLYLKIYKHDSEAELQFKTMNVLHRRLIQHDVGVKAVRHLALVQGNDSYSTAVVEPAPGEYVRRRLSNYSDMNALTDAIIRQLDKAIPFHIRHILINDINRYNNKAGNLVQDEDGTYYLFDQPFVNSNAPHLLMRSALGWLERTTPS